MRGARAAPVPAGPWQPFISTHAPPSPAPWCRLGSWGCSCQAAWEEERHLFHEERAEWAREQEAGGAGRRRSTRREGRAPSEGSGLGAVCAQDLFCAFQGGAAGGEGSAVTFIKIHQFYSHTIEGLLAKPAGARRCIPAAQGTCAGYEHGEEGAAAARF